MKHSDKTELALCIATTVLVLIGVILYISFESTMLTVFSVILDFFI